MSSVSATLAVWSAAWLHGAAASDDVLDALGCWAERHEARADTDELSVRLGLPSSGETPAGSAVLLSALRAAGAQEAELILPVPGDVRGLDGSTRFAKAALRAGQAVVFRQVRLGLVPDAAAVDGVQLWTVFELADSLHTAPAVGLGIGEAEHGLSSAMREAASSLIDLGVAKHRSGVREEIAEMVASQPQPSWPDSVPSRALRVLQRASEVEAILWAATADAPGGALSASATQARTSALRPLFDAVRSARCVAVAEMVRVLVVR